MSTRNELWGKRWIHSSWMEMKENTGKNKRERERIFCYNSFLPGDGLGFSDFDRE